MERPEFFIQTVRAVSPNQHMAIVARAILGRLFPGSQHELLFSKTWVKNPAASETTKSTNHGKHRFSASIHPYTCAVVLFPDFSYVTSSQAKYLLTSSAWSAPALYPLK